MASSTSSFGIISTSTCLSSSDLPTQIESAKNLLLIETNYAAFKPNSPVDGSVVNL